MNVLDETRADIERLVAQDFDAANVGDYETKFINWLHYKARQIPRRPRKVFVSPQVMNRQFEFPSIEHIRKNLIDGYNVEPWLSNNLRKNEFTHESDMMFNDWQISHFHLGNGTEINKSGLKQSVSRSSLLLFVHISADNATMIDISEHGSWTKTSLLEILLRTNPIAFRQCELFGIKPDSLTDDERTNLRACGGNSPVEIEGRAFMPGRGIMSSKHAMRLVLYMDWFFDTPSHN